MKEYKVVSMDESYVWGRFDEKKLQKLLNEYADEGWELNSAFSSNWLTCLGTNKDVVVILERTKE